MHQALLLTSFRYISVIDAMGKPSSAILQGDFNWLGSYDECVGIQAYVNISGKIRSSYKGRYCTSSLKIDIPLISQQVLFYYLNSFNPLTGQQQTVETQIRRRKMHKIQDCLFKMIRNNEK